MVLPTAGKPKGGFQFISIAQLCAVWCAYDSKHIRMADVRLWCAAQEMTARRCQLPAEQQPRYRHGELTHLVGGAGGMTAALKRLRTTRLLVWDARALIFPQPESDSDVALTAMLAQIPNQRRRIPVPRRLLRLIALGCSRVVFATILGHLFRCLYYRQGQCRADGFCKASWIAQVFGVSERAVKTARQRLEALGFLQRTETPQWVRNRHGQKMMINLQWAGKAMPKIETPETRMKTAPPLAPEAHTIAPLDSDKELLTEQKHQKPTSGGSAGVLSTLVAQIREAMRNGICVVEEPPPLRRDSGEVLVYTTPLPATTSKPRTLPSPQLAHVIRLDLQDLARLLALYTQAVHRQLIGSSEAERLAFVALAQHVLHFRPVNPGGLFLQLLKRQHFAFITQEEEDTARRRLSAYEYPDPPGAGLSAVA